jgi:predicted porin
VYGIADIGVQYDDPKVDGESATKNVVSGARSGSRLGFRGTEDLGGGLNAIFTIESGINLDTGTVGQGGRMWGRQAFVGLKSSSFGTLVAGRVGTFSSGTGSFDMIGDFDPLATSYGIAGLESSLSSTSGLRTDNTVLYQSPVWSGFQFGVAHSRQITGAEASGDDYASFFGAKYTAGAFGVAVTYDLFNNAAGGKDQKNLQVGVTYDFGVVKLFGAYGLEKNQFNADLSTTETDSGADAKGYMLGFTAPLGTSGLLRASYQLRDGDNVGGDERDRRVASIAYEYMLSKRTMIYTALADSDGKKTLDENPDYDRRVISLGINHRF